MFSYVYLISESRSVHVTQISTLICHNTSSTKFFPVDGSILFAIDQFVHPISGILTSDYTMSVDLSIPTLKFPTGNGSEHVLAFLLCSPHASIQTRQVWATGNGNLTLGKHQPNQGNIDLLQANYLLSYILRMLPTGSGPTTTPGQVGTDMMVKSSRRKRTHFLALALENKLHWKDQAITRTYLLIWATSTLLHALKFYVKDVELDRGMLSSFQHLEMLYLLVFLKQINLTIRFDNSQIKSFLNQFQEDFHAFVFNLAQEPVKLIIDLHPQGLPM